MFYSVCVLDLCGNIILFFVFFGVCLDFVSKLYVVYDEVFVEKIFDIDFEVL